MTAIFSELIFWRLRTQNAAQNPLYCKVPTLPHVCYYLMLSFWGDAGQLGSHADQRGLSVPIKAQVPWVCGVNLLSLPASYNVISSTSEHPIKVESTEEEGTIQEETRHHKVRVPYFIDMTPEVQRRQEC